jgi:two-component system response regulator ResD
VAANVLIVEDDALLCDVLRMYLEKEGYQVQVAQDGATGLQTASSTPVDLVVLDVMLPKMDGFEVCRRLRLRQQTPVLLLTARGEESDKVKGFDMGADDYLTKPFSMQEFLARVRALLKRALIVPKHENEMPDEQILTFPTLVIDNRRHRVERQGRPVRLTPKEFALLWFLANHAGTVVRREELLKVVWGYDSNEDSRTIHTHVNRLRAKLETQGQRYIHTVWGVGYKFEVVPR